MTSGGPQVAHPSMVNVLGTMKSISESSIQLPILQQGFIVSAGNLFWLVTTVADTNYPIQKNNLFLVLAITSQHQKSIFEKNSQA
jgi:hypothetical protein